MNKIRNEEGHWKDRKKSRGTEKKVKEGDRKRKKKSKPSIRDRTYEKYNH